MWYRFGEEGNRNGLEIQVDANINDAASVEGVHRPGVRIASGDYIYPRHEALPRAPTHSLLCCSAREFRHEVQSGVEITG